MYSGNDERDNTISPPDSVAVFPAGRERQIRNILHNLETLVEALPLHSEELLGAIRDLPTGPLTKLDALLKQLLENAEKQSS